MELKDLKTALFGFNKNDVCEYISYLNLVYEQKEIQKLQHQKELTEELNRKNEELNNYNSRLSQENTELKRNINELQKKLNLLNSRSVELELQIKGIQNTTVSVLKDIKEQLNTAEKRITDLHTEQGDE